MASQTESFMASYTGSFDEPDLSPYRQLLPLLSQKPAAYLLTALIVIVVAYALQGSKNQLPRYNPTGPFELTTRRVVAEYIPRGLEILIQARKKYGNQPYRLYSDFGDIVVLPGEAMKEIRNDPALQFMEMVNYVCTIRLSLPSTTH